MKRDINLMVQKSKGNTYIILISAVIVVVFLLAILIPLNRKNLRADKVKKMTREIMGFELLEDEYRSLENQYIDLEKRVELLKGARSNEQNIIELIEIIDSSISSHVDLTSINISGEILEIKGKAPRDTIIAAIVERLTQKDRILSARIQETILDKKDSKKMFSIKCIIRLDQPNLETLSREEDEINETDDINEGRGDN